MKGGREGEGEKSEGKREKKGGMEGERDRGRQ